jgi:hypothetical protein
MSNVSLTAGFPQDYIDYDGGPAVIRAISAAIVLATLFVGLRLWVRVSRGIGFGVDDYLCVASLIVVWGEYVDDYLCITQGGVGRHLLVNLERDPNTIRTTMIVSLPCVFHSCGFTIVYCQDFYTLAIRHWIAVVLFNASSTCIY